MSLILFAIEWQLFSKVAKDKDGQPKKDAQGNVIREGNPAVGHFVNILLFGLTALCLYWLLLALLEQKRTTLTISQTLAEIQLRQWRMVDC